MDYFYNYTPSSDELYHYGVLGQRWGRRRYQYADGSLTPEGRKHYGVAAPIIEAHNKRVNRNELKKSAKAAAKDNDAEDAKQRSSSTRTKKVSQMTDEELRERISRLTLEKNMLSLERDVSSLQPQQISAGQKFAKQISQAAADSIVTAAKSTMTSYLTEAGKKAVANATKVPKSELDMLQDEAKKLKLKEQIKKSKDYLNGKGSGNNNKEDKKDQQK